MSTASTLIAIEALLSLLARSAEVARIVGYAQAQGRDLTQAELDAIVAENDSARARLVAAIEAAKPPS